MTLLRFALACLVCATVGRAQAPPPAFDVVVMIEGETPWRGGLPLGAVSTK